MIYLIIRNVTAICLCTCLFNSAFSQGETFKNKPVVEKKEAKPFKILTNGKRITVQSNREIQTILVWTGSGNRIIEQQELNTNSYSFVPPAYDKIYFVMVQMKDGKVFTEKIGTQ